jgi:hypothetical protein
VQKLGVFGTSEQHIFFSVQPDTVFYMDSEQGDMQTPAVTLASIGGLNEVIRELQEMMEMALTRVNPIPGKNKFLIFDIEVYNLFYCVRSQTFKRRTFIWCSWGRQKYVSPNIVCYKWSQFFHD